MVIRWPFICRLASIFFDVVAITIFPFVFVRDEAPPRLVQHERIHILQQLETLVILFYVIYALCFLLNLLRFRSASQAYQRIPFESEAYAHESTPDYFKTRKFLAWLRA